MLKLFLSIVIIFQTSTFALSLDERRKAIISIIDEELNEVSRLSKEVGGRNPDYLLRMAELNLEKARLWREKENSEFLSLPDDKRRKINKASYFRQSSAYFSKANQLCIEITKKFPRYKSITDVYYILGYNAKEAGQNQTAQKYFQAATKGQSPNALTQVKSKISLAEIYYNQQKYSQAIPLYESSLQKHQDKWWTKDSFNLAWSYFRVRNYNAAINKMLQVYERSKNKQYIDMRSQVQRDIGLFYAMGGKINEGISFYKKIGINFTDQLIKIAIALKEEGKYTDAKNVLAQALKYEKREEKIGDIYIELLVLYDQFGKEREHLNTTEQAFKLFQNNKLKSNHIKQLTFQSKKSSARLQKQVASTTYKKLATQRTQKMNYAIRYFEILSVIDSKNKLEYEFLRAETAYAGEDYQRALSFYKQSLNTAKEQNNKKFIDDSLEGMLSCLGQRSLPQSIKNQYYESTYEAYLAICPKSNLAQSIYPKLYNVYLGEKKYDKAKSVLDRYAKHYPNDFKTQEAMIAPLMDAARSRKDFKAIGIWITDIDAKKYAVSPQYRSKLKELMTSIQIEGVQQSLSRGEKRQALLGYHKILEDPYSTDKSKINAKYNLAALYYELGSTTQSYQWSVEALREMPSSDAVKFSDSFLTIAGFLFTKLEFQASADISKRIVAKLCSENSRRKSVAFKNTIFIYLSEGMISETEEMINIAKRCKVPSNFILDANIELLKEMRDRKMWTEYENKVMTLQGEKAISGELVYHFYTLEKIHENYNNQNKQNLYSKLKWQAYRDAVKLKKDIPLDGLDVIADELLKNMMSKRKNIEAINLRFPDNVYNNLLKQKLEGLNELTQRAKEIQEIGSGRGIIGAYKLLFEAYNHVANEIKDFVPEGKSEDFIKSFKGAMSEVYGPLLETANSYKNEGWQAIEENQILSDFNFLLSPYKPFGQAIRYDYPRKALKMDRGGKR